MGRNDPYPGANPAEAERWVGMYRSFGGKRYWLYASAGGFFSGERGQFAFERPDAEELASEFKSRGWKVRVVKWTAHPELCLIYARRGGR
jgi:hypothetical protein